MWWSRRKPGQDKASRRAGQQPAEDDGDGRNARLVFRAGQDGTHFIQATSFNAGRGAFALTALTPFLQGNNSRTATWPTGLPPSTTGTWSFGP